MDSSPKNVVEAHAKLENQSGFVMALVLVVVLLMVGAGIYFLQARGRTSEIHMTDTRLENQINRLHDRLQDGS